MWRRRQGRGVGGDEIRIGYLGMEVRTRWYGSRTLESGWSTLGSSG
jgi:hypothetical protein